MTVDKMRKVFGGTGMLAEIKIWTSEDVRPDHAGERWVNGLYRTEL